MNEDMILENEIDIPEDWETNVIYIRNDSDKVVEVEVPDDKEE
jgi:hypothetical protein